MQVRREKEKGRGEKRKEEREKHIIICAMPLL